MNTRSEIDEVKSVLIRHYDPAKPVHHSVLALIEKYETSLHRIRELEALLDRLRPRRAAAAGREARWAKTFYEKWQALKEATDGN